MSVGEQADFVAAMAKVADLIKSTQAALQRARSLCHSQIYEEVDLMSKRLYELKVKSEWVRYAALGKIKLGTLEPEVRLGADRRLGIDRRVAGMQKQILSALPEEADPAAPAAYARSRSSGGS